MWRYTTQLVARPTWERTRHLTLHILRKRAFVYCVIV